MIVVFADALHIRPQALLDIDAIAVQRPFEIAVLQPDLLAEEDLILRRTMLERVIEFRQPAQQLRFIHHQLVFPALPPLGPMLADVLELLHLSLQRRAHVRQAFVPMTIHSGHQAARLFQRIQRSLHATHHIAIEHHLLAHVPIERPRNRVFQLLRQPVQRAAAARIHCADGRHLGLRGIARAQQRH